MSFERLAAIVRKDLLLVVRNRGVLLPLLITPTLLLFLLPAALVLGPQLLLGGTPIAEPGTLDGLIPTLAGGDASAPSVWEQTVLIHLAAPLYLLVPLVAATVIAADTFAGERERGTLEALLHTPATDRELVLGKLLVAYVPASILGIVSFALYTVWANVLGAGALGGVFFPTTSWFALVFWLAPAVSALGLGLLVAVSHRVRSLQAAHQVGSLIVTPFVLVVVAQIGGTLTFDLSTVMIFGTVVWVVATAVIVWAVASFDRDRVASRL